MPCGTSSRPCEIRDSAASGLWAGLSPRLSWRVIGSTRRFDLCTDARRRACRSGSIAQQRTLQYLAVAFLTGIAQPRRAQILRCGCCESDACDAFRPATGAVYGCPDSPCQHVV